MLLMNAGPKEATVYDRISLPFYQVKNIQNIPVRVFITSRPELEITEKFLMLDHPDDLADTRRDIFIFLEAKLHEVAKKTKTSLSGWLAR